MLGELGSEVGREGALHSHTKGIRLEDSETIVVFLKHFDTIKQSLFGVGGIHIPHASRVSDLIRKNLCDWATLTGTTTH